VGNEDNPRTGAEFERLVAEYFRRQGLALQSRYPQRLGSGQKKGIRTFDLGSNVPPVLVECKCHTWTQGGNAPSAKLAVWNEAMYFFALAPRKFRKILAVLRSIRGEVSLASHYLSRFEYLVPTGVEIWEFNSQTGKGEQVR
jgi:hypothetical protein